MFHKDNLGRFGSNLPCDIDGYVPEAGDEWGTMDWDYLSREEFEGPDGEEVWGEFLAEAVEATKRAEAAAKRWRQGGQR